MGLIIFRASSEAPSSACVPPLPLLCPWTDGARAVSTYSTVHAHVGLALKMCNAMPDASSGHKKAFLLHGGPKGCVLTQVGSVTDQDAHLAPVDCSQNQKI